MDTLKYLTCLWILVSAVVHAYSEIVSIRQEYYEGDRIQIECFTTENYSVVWQRADGRSLPGKVYQVDSHLIIEHAKHKHSGDYSCVARNSNETIGRTVNIKVLRRPPTKLVISPILSYVIEGQNTYLVCSGIANTASIRWVRQDGAPLGSNIETRNGFLYIKGARFENDGVYTCQASKAEEVSVYVSVIGFNSLLFTPSKVEVSVNELTIVEGKSDNIECGVLGHPVPTIKWKKVDGNFSPRTSQNGTTLVISNAQVGDGGRYVCTGLVAGTPVTTTYVTINIQTLVRPIVQLIPQGEVNAQAGKPFELHCNVLEGLPYPVVSWSKEGRSIEVDSAHPNVLKFISIDFVDEGEYVCTAVNEVGTDSAAVTLKVSLRVSMTQVGYDGRDELQNATIVCRAYGCLDSMVSIKKWEKSGFRIVVPTTLSIASLYLPTVNDNDLGTYLCTASCSQPKNQVVHEQHTLQRPFQFKYDRDEVVLEGQNVRLSCDGSGSGEVAIAKIKEDLRTEYFQESGEITIESATKADAGLYGCYLKLPRGYDFYASETFRLSVLRTPRITLRPQNLTVSPGEARTIECVVEEDSILDVTWDLSEKSSRHVEANNSTLVFHHVRVEDSGKYTCFARNTLAFASAVAEVTVITAPVDQSTSS